jgi:hypothetical protein
VIPSWPDEVPQRATPRPIGGLLIQHHDCAGDRRGRRGRRSGPHRPASVAVIGGWPPLGERCRVGGVPERMAVPLPGSALAELGASLDSWITPGASPASRLCRSLTGSTYRGRRSGRGAG